MPTGPGVEVPRPHGSAVTGGRPGEQPAPHRPVIFATVVLALLMASLDQTIVATALHAIQNGLHTSIVWAGWTLTAYSLGQVLMLSMSGRLSDHYGRRRVFMGSVIVFTAASLCCGLVNNIYLLIALRTLQAIGGAGFTPSATGIVVDHFGSARDRAVGLFGSIFPIGASLGPIFGGILVAHLSWRAIFLVNVPIGVLLLLLSAKFIPPDEPRSSLTARRLDGVGMAQLGVTVIAGMLGLSYLGGSESTLWSPPFLGLAAIAVMAAIVFVRHSRRAADPFIPAQLIYGRGYGVTNVINFLFGGAVAGLGSLVPLYAVERYHIDVLSSGTLLTARSVGMIVLSILAVYALRRTGYRSPMVVGFLLTAVGFLALDLAPLGMSPYAWLAAGTAVIGIGQGWSGPASRNASLQLDPSHSAAIAGLRTTCRQSGAIAAVSLTTAILARSADQGTALGHVFVVFAVLLVLLSPIVLRVPEHRGAW